jgi:hypothetical protein
LRGFYLRGFVWRGGNICTFILSLFPEKDISTWFRHTTFLSSDKFMERREQNKNRSNLTILECRYKFYSRCGFKMSDFKTASWPGRD